MASLAGPVRAMECIKLPNSLEASGQAYVMWVASNFTLTLAVLASCGATAALIGDRRYPGAAASQA
jgi:hypothetical protein